MMANLFLHHFPEANWRGCCARRRSRPGYSSPSSRAARREALLFSRLLWLIGCNQVTRHDAPVSVRAGFAGCELSRLWPAGRGWTLQERPAGWFSHLFIAQRRE